MRTALVTGGCGFIGRQVVEELLRRGYAVRILDIADPCDAPQGAVLHRGSILDAGLLAEAMDGASLVIHTAGISHLWVKAADDLTEVNARGTERVLQAAAAAGVERVVHCSTEAILLPEESSGGEPVREDRLPPVEAMSGVYTRSKHAAELAALAAVRGGLDVVIASPTVPIGAADRNLTPPAAMLARFLGGCAPLFLDCTLNLVDVRDVGLGMVLAAERGRTAERYVLGGENLGLRDLLARLARLSGRPMPTIALPGAAAMAVAALTEWTSDHVTGRAPPATREGVRLALRSAPFACLKARDELGYRPRPVEGALADAVRWLSADNPEPLLARLMPGLSTYSN